MEESVTVLCRRSFFRHISFSDRIPVFSATVVMESEKGRSVSLLFVSCVFLHAVLLWHCMDNLVLRRVEEILKDYGRSVFQKVKRNPHQWFL